MRRLTRRPSPALVVASIALFVSLGGVSYGVATGSIDSREIKNGSIQGQDIAGRSIEGTKIRVNRVGGNAVKEESLQTERIARVPRAENADTLAGRPPSRYTTRWALINEGGQIEQQTGGFSVVNCFQANRNCYIDAGEDVTDNGVDAEIAAVNLGGFGPSDISGQTGTAPCGKAFVNCAPPGTENPNVIVIAPRTNDGSPRSENFRFYVFVTDSSTG